MEDWQGDLRGGTMTFDRYVLSMFEIVDLWSDTVDELDYVILLNPNPEPNPDPNPNPKPNPNPNPNADPNLTLPLPLTR